MLRSIDIRTWTIWLVAFVVLALAGCTGIGGGGASSSPGHRRLTAAELRLRLIDELGPLWHCDQNSYPVGRDELEALREKWPQLVADAELAEAIRLRLTLPPLDDAGLDR